ncbi:hypothetical protein P9Y62_27870 [Bacillus thuringiensis]|nr:hypothetical protein [Bacillus thuringiensis]EEM38406.1 hypothetical protein bthur0004_56980 [Bacillus thuringiensis serovar sotto str. T04001]MEB4893689.1 hypothetical protein [Bacillus thuringiensis]MEC2564879.1 hypothetical protein [Bacillus thuringiensis]MEC2646416.1 hypothetical protein [Bacillus thuringiensis]MEC2727746.1 hypothetical protein [Bacillus thuringiensis]
MKLLSEEETYLNDDPLAFAKGCKNGLIMVIPFWALVVGVVSFIV